MPDREAAAPASAQDRAVIEAISRSRLFRGVAIEDLAAIAPMLRERRYRSGETIFHEGDPGDAMHVIASGGAKISIASQEGDEAILATLGPGEVIRRARPSRRRAALRDGRGGRADGDLHPPPDCVRPAHRRE